MADRTYSVAEIEKMRQAIYRIGKYSPIPSSATAVEEQLRTYIANGTEPAELEEMAGGLEATE